MDGCSYLVNVPKVAVNVLGQLSKHAHWALIQHMETKQQGHQPFTELGIL